MKTPDQYPDINHKFSFRHEKPIESIDEDKNGLNYNNFAKNLAINIQNYFKNNDECLTIGLMGDWGSGKTSILNLTKIHLDANIKIMEFNPWIYSSYNQLISQFFDELILQFSSSSEKNLINNLKSYLFKLNKSNFIKSVLPILTSVASEDVGKIMGEILNFDSEEQSLEKIKDNINDELEKHKIVCIIDDLDRLNSTEINEMFRLIKIMANFKNMVYIIAFDKNIISNALKGNYGENFIEKIINVPLEVPLTSQLELKRLLISQLRELSKKHDISVDQIKMSSLLDSNDFDHTTKLGILYYFNTVRDIKRFINILEFNIELIKNEVDFADFVTITAIQMFKHDLYEKIKMNESLFVRCPYSKEDYELNYDLCQKEQFQFEHVIDDDDNSKYLLQELFPKMKFIYDVHFPLFFSAYDVSLSICHKNHFKTYFKLNPILKEINEYEISLTIDIINSKMENEIIKHFKNLDEMGKLDLFFKNLKNRLSKIDDKEFLLHLIFSLYRKFGEVFNKEELLLADICLKLISQIKSEDRYELLKKEYESSNHLDFLFKLAIGIDDDERFEKPLLVSFQINELKRILKNKFQIMLVDHSQYVEKNLINALNLGQCLGLSSEVDEFIVSYISTIKNLLTFLRLFISDSGEFSEHEIQRLSDFTDLNPIKHKIDENYWDIENEIVVEKFLKGYELWLDDVID